MFKKAVVVILSVVFISGIFFVNNMPVFYKYADKYEVYLTDYSCSSATKNVLLLEYLFTFNVKGESCVIAKKEFEIQEFLSDFSATEIFSESTGEIVCVYAYSPKIKYSKNIGGKTVNLHFAIGKDQVKVGSPIIYGSF